MASKVAAAKIAAWSGVRAVIAAADRPDVLLDAVAGVAGVGHGRAPARAAPPGPQAVDRVRGRRRRAWSSSTRAPGGRWSSGNRSLLPAGVVGVQGDVRWPTTRSSSPVPTATCSPRASPASTRIGSLEVAGRRTAELPEGMPHEVVHRDDLVVLPS